MGMREQTLIWQRLDTPGLEFCTLTSSQQGWVLEGTVVTTFEEQPSVTVYHVLCDQQWHTRQAVVTCDLAGRTSHLLLAADDAHEWWLNDEALPDLHGCVDVDLGITPATNTLPIRRLGLANGESRLVTAAWVHFPSLAIRPLPQRYTRTAADHYRYESGWELSAGGPASFTAELSVDALGLVVDYPPIWRRIAAQGPVEG